MVSFWLKLAKMTTFVQAMVNYDLRVIAVVIIVFSGQLIMSIFKSTIIYIFISHQTVLGNLKTLK